MTISIKKAKLIHYIFRLRSSRGTDMCFCLKFRAGTSQRDIRDAMEWFAEKMTEGTACREYTVSWKRVKMEPRRILLKRYDIACKRLQKAKAQQQALAAMLNPRENGWTE